MPRVVIGIPMYCGEEHVAGAIQSLLAQQYDDYALIAVDDASPDGTFEVATKCAAAHPRAVVEANATRLGMIASWNAVFERARALYGAFEFFAWGSDHDRWHEQWLPVLVHELEQEPTAVLAYPRTSELLVDGSLVASRSELDTRSLTTTDERLVATVREMRAGLMIYGLFRTEALRSAGLVPGVLLSDSLLLAHLSLYGPFVQVRDELWTRRRTHETSRSRRSRAKALFGGRVPFHVFLPGSVSHAGWLTWWLLLRGRRPAGMSRLAAARAIGRLLVLRSAQASRRRLDRVDKVRRRRSKAGRSWWRKRSHSVRRAWRRLRKRLRTWWNAARRRRGRRSHEPRS